MNSIRAFIALDLSPGSRHAIAKVIRRLEPRFPGIKWINAEQLHLTLHFLGDVLFSDINRVCSVAREAAEEIPPFSIHLKGLGAFPDTKSPRVIWVGVEQGHLPLVELQSALKGPLGEMGYPSDKNVFKPHITVGRVKRSGDLMDLQEQVAKYESSDFGVTAVDELTVYESQLNRGGPDYSVISEIELG
ncbi:MAG: RNA 2',3'-cyclic phosphodiesterase [Planctomycetota bacterium]|nr:RNA 2',3'-cyclic phosphodiesterase [Planctomycetota bacterium]